MFFRITVYKCLQEIIRLTNGDGIIQKPITGDNLARLYSQKGYPKAIRALSDRGCISVKWVGNEPYWLTIKDRSFTYLLERSEVWLNRIIGFIAGVATSVLTSMILQLL